MPKRDCIITKSEECIFKEPTIVEAKEVENDYIHRGHKEEQVDKGIGNDDIIDELESE